MVNLTKLLTFENVNLKRKKMSNVPAAFLIFSYNIAGQREEYTL